MQRLINPFVLKNQEVFPGEIYRNDKIVSSNVTFNISPQLLNYYFLGKLDIIIPSLSYQDARSVRSLYGISPNIALDQSIDILASNMVKEVLYIIRHLTCENTPFRLLDHIRTDISELSSELFEMVRYINSHRMIESIEGAPASAIKWENVNLEFPKEVLDSNSDKLILYISKFNNLCKYTKLDGITKFDDLSQLFKSSEHSLSISTNVNTNKSNGITSVDLELGDGSDEIDLKYALLLCPRYDIKDKQIYQCITHKLDLNKIRQILKLPVKLFMDGNINNTVAERPLNEYMKSDLISQSGKEQNFKGFSSGSKPFASGDSKPNLKEGKSNFTFKKGKGVDTKRSDVVDTDSQDVLDSNKNNPEDEVSS